MKDLRLWIKDQRSYVFHNNKSLISINEVEINKIVLSDKTSCGGTGSFKRCIGDRHKDRTFSPLNVKLP